MGCQVPKRGIQNQTGFWPKINIIERNTLFSYIRPAGIIILHSLQMRVLLENTTFLLHKIVRIAGIIRVAGIIRGRALYEEIRYW